MVTLSRDTPAEIERLQIDQLREMPAARKLALVGEMNRTVRTMALAGLRQRHPGETPDQHQRRLASLLLGPDLAARAYGPLPKDA